MTDQHAPASAYQPAMWVITTDPIPSLKLPPGHPGKVIRTGFNDSLAVQFISKIGPTDSVTLLDGATKPIWDFVAAVPDDFIPLVMLFQDANKTVRHSANQIAVLTQMLTEQGNIADVHLDNSTLELPRAQRKLSEAQTENTALKEEIARLKAIQPAAAPATPDTQIEVCFVRGSIKSDSYLKEIAALRNDGWLFAHEQIEPGEWNDAQQGYIDSWHCARAERRIPRTAVKQLTPDEEAAKPAPVNPTPAPSLNGHKPAIIPVPAPVPAPEREEAAASLSLPLPGLHTLRLVYISISEGRREKYHHALGFDKAGNWQVAVLFDEHVDMLRNVKSYDTSGFDTPNMAFKCAFDIILDTSKPQWDGGYRMRFHSGPVPNSLRYAEFVTQAQQQGFQLGGIQPVDYATKLAELISINKDAQTRKATPAVKPSAATIIFGLPDSPPLPMPDAAPKYASRAEQIKAESDARIAEAVAPFMAAAATASKPTESLKDFMARTKPQPTAKAG